LYKVKLRPAFLKDLGGCLPDIALQRARQMRLVKKACLLNRILNGNTFLQEAGSVTRAFNLPLSTLCQSGRSQEMTLDGTRVAALQRPL